MKNYGKKYYKAFIYKEFNLCSGSLLLHKEYHGSESWYSLCSTYTYTTIIYGSHKVVSQAESEPKSLSTVGSGEPLNHYSIRAVSRTALSHEGRTKRYLTCQECTH